LNDQKPFISVQQREFLLRKAQAGDVEALNSLFDSCRRRLYCQALRILGRPQDAEDAVQEAMLAAFTHLNRFQGRADFLTWASRIVINASLQYIRKNRAMPTVAVDWVDNEFGGASFQECLRDPQPTPEERLQELEHQEMLQGALHKLPAESRHAIQLCKFADYSLKEAANALGLPVGTLKARLHRGKRELMVRLQTKTQVRRKPAPKKGSLPICRISKEGLRAA
jgi:RNA polymerase sigma-70 factor (ECF subfamily)